MQWDKKRWRGRKEAKDDRSSENSREQMEQRRTDTREGTRDQKEERGTTGGPVMRGAKEGEEGWSRKKRKRASEVTRRKTGGWRRGKEQLVLQ